MVCHRRCVSNAATNASGRWGEELTIFYNSAHSPITGVDKHPCALGQQAQAVWPEIWDVVGAPIRAVLQQGRTSSHEEQLLVLERREADGSLSWEEFYLTVGTSLTCVLKADRRMQWTFFPIFLESGAVGGVFTPIYDVTARVVSERRMIAMRELAARLSTARTFTQLLMDSCEVLSQLELDLPYAAAYRIQKEVHAGVPRTRLRCIPLAYAPLESRDALASTTFILQETIGIPFDTRAAPARVVVDGSGGCGDAPWDLSLLRGAENDIVLFEGVQHLLAELPLRGHAEARPRVAAALPVVQGAELVGCVIVYISGARPVTPTLRTFLVLLARQISTSASVVAAYEDEVQSTSVRTGALSEC
jgi:hypothetical protein